MQRYDANRASVADRTDEIFRGWHDKLSAAGQTDALAALTKLCPSFCPCIVAWLGADRSVVQGTRRRFRTRRAGRSGARLMTTPRGSRPTSRRFVTGRRLRRRRTRARRPWTRLRGSGRSCTTCRTRRSTARRPSSTPPEGRALRRCGVVSCRRHKLKSVLSIGHLCWYYGIRPIGCCELISGARRGARLTAIPHLTETRLVCKDNGVICGPGTFVW